MGARRMLAAAALIVVLAALLTLASCNKQHSLAKQPSPAKQQPNASLLAADISKLGFIPGKPVTLPPGFKAECRVLFGKKAYDFADGFYITDEKDVLNSLMMMSPKLNDPDKATAGMTKEQADAFRRSIKNAERKPEDTKGLVGSKVPRDRQSRINFRTWSHKDVFSLSERELLGAYGPPSQPPTGPEELTVPLGDGVPAFTFTTNTIEYIFQVSDGQYWRVVFMLGKQANGEELVDMVGMNKLHLSEKHPLGKRKVYPWPGLYPAPAAK
jgi:hypothetical protein